MNLSSEQRQMIAIARTMTRPLQLLLIDDPDPLLSYTQRQKLLSLIERWRQQGTTIIFSSSSLDQLTGVTDRILALRHGRLIAEFETDKVSHEQLVSALVGNVDSVEITPVIWALDSYYRTRDRVEKLLDEHLALEQNVTTLDNLNQKLINQLNEQVKALNRANAALQDAHRRLITEREQERKRLARELHDVALQDLLSVNYQLEEIEASEESIASIRDALLHVRNNIRKLIEDLRRICGDLRPPTIDNLGLGAAVKSLVHTWSQRTNTVTSLKLDPNLGRMSEAVELSVFRIIQEGLNNISKHAHANSVQISLKRTSPRTLLLSIADDGIGLPDSFDLSTLSSQKHYGLLGISERVALVGGRLNISNQTNSGMLLQAEIPHQRVEGDRANH